MTEAEKLAIQMACQRLAADCSYFSDRGRIEDYANLYIEDGLFTRPGLEARGRSVIEAALRQRPPHVKTRHITSDTIVDVVSSDEATGRGTQLFVAHDASSGTTAAPVPVDFEDRYVRTTEGWRIAERKALPSF